MFPERPRISDDTLLTIATCDAIVETRGVVTAAAIAETMRRRFLAGRFHGLGSSTLKALRDLAAGAHWALSGARGEYAAGSGAAMRAAPLAFCLDPDADDDRVCIRDIARITHHSDEAYVGALAAVAAVRLCALRGEVPDSLLTEVASMLPDSRVRDRMVKLQTLYGADVTAGAALGSTGYVVDAVPLALFIAARSRETDVEGAVRRAVSCGGDTDTVASLAAQVVGASGREPPSELLEQIDGIRDVQASVERFADLIRTA